MRFFNSADAIMTERDIKDVLTIVLKNLPSVNVQKAVVDEIERLKRKGYSEHYAINCVFENNNFANKAH